MFEEAMRFALEAHKGWIRTLGRDIGLPYIVHPVRVAMAALEKRGPEAAVVGILHDVLENPRVGWGQLRRGDERPFILSLDGLTLELPTTIGRAVVRLARDYGDTYSAYIDRVASNPLAAAVKRLDIEDNLAGLPEGHSLRKRYEAALHVLG